MERIAFVVFAVTICVLFKRELDATRVYAQKLRVLRKTCFESLSAVRDGQEPKEMPAFMSMLVRVGEKTFFERNTKTNATELLRLAKKIDTETLTFVHAPDFEDTSHIVALYKEESKKGDETILCVAAMDT